MKRVIFPLLSGGVDSTIATLKRLETEDYTAVQPIFINYGQRVCEKEWTAVTKITKMIAERFEDDTIRFIEPKRINLRSCPQGDNEIFHWSKSQLFTGDPNGCPYVENRNMILLSIAASFAETKIGEYDEGIIITGFRNEYSDTEHMFTEFMNRVFDFVYTPIKKIIRIENPVVIYGAEGKQFTDRQHFLFIRKDQFPVLLIDDNYRVFIDFFFQDYFGQFIL